MTSVLQSAWGSVVRRAVGKTSDDPAALSMADPAKLDSVIDEYNGLYVEDAKTQGRDKKKRQERANNYTTLVNHYYDLVTDFYEYGWGQSFHFAPRYKGETFLASLARHEHFLSAKLGLQPGMKCLDAGCGVGGPMRAIARFSGASVVGVNNNAYQIQRSDSLNNSMGLKHLCSNVKANFMALPFEAETFDKIYTIEASVHAPNRVDCFSEMFRTLKPGGSFAGYEWVMTPNYDESNAEHNRIKHDIEHGNGLTDLPSAQDIVDALEEAGFEVTEHFDVAETAPAVGNEIEWHSTLKWDGGVSSLKHSKGGRRMTQLMVDVLETMKVAPKGTSKTHHMLCSAADSLAEGGDLKIFTPMLYFLAKKPL